MKIVLCAVDTRLAGAWRRALPQPYALCPRPFPVSLADVYAF